MLSSIPQSAGRAAAVSAGAKGPERRAHGRRNPRLVPVLEPAHGLLRGLHRRLRQREQGTRRARHGAGQLPAVVRPPDKRNRRADPARSPRGYARGSTTQAATFERSKVLVRRAVVALGQRRALARLALARRRVAARDAAVERAGLDLLLDERARGRHALVHRPGDLGLRRDREIAPGCPGTATRSGFAKYCGSRASRSIVCSQASSTAFRYSACSFAITYGSTRSLIER